MENPSNSSKPEPALRLARHRQPSYISRGKRIRRIYDVLRGYDEDSPEHDRSKRSVRYNVRDEVADWKKSFAELRCMGEDAKAQLMSPLRKHISSVAWIKYSLLERSVVFISACSFLLIPIAGVLWALFPKLGPPMVSGPGTLLIAVSFGAAGSMTRLHGLSLRQLADYLARMEAKRRYWWIGLFFYFASVYIDPGYPPDAKTLFGGFSGLASFLLALIAGMWFEVHALVWANASIQQDKSGIRPQSFIVEGYQNLLFFLNEHPSFLSRPRSAPKRQCMSLLEEIAVVLERDSWEPLRSGDRSTDIWAKDRAHRMASAVRGLKKWVLSPKADTYEHLCTRIISDMSHIARGEWDDMPQEDAPTSGSSALVRASVFVLRFLGTAAGLLLASNITGHAPTWISEHYSLILVAFAGIMTILNRLDPASSPTITSYKDILKSLEEIGKKP